MHAAKRLDMRLEGSGRVACKMRSDVSFTSTTTDESFEPATDEGSIHGALVCCVMTRVGVFSKPMNVPPGDVGGGARLRGEGRQTGDDPYIAIPNGPSPDINLDSDALATDQHCLIKAAKQGCFFEQSLKRGLEVNHRLKIGGTWHDA